MVAFDGMRQAEGKSRRPRGFFCTISHGDQYSPALEVVPCLTARRGVAWISIIESLQSLASFRDDVDQDAGDSSQTRDGRLALEPSCLLHLKDEIGD
jgi:hypothetical protein